MSRTLWSKKGSRVCARVQADGLTMHSGEVGQDIAEYGLLVGFIAVGAVLVVAAVGAQVATMWDSVSILLAGIPWPF